KGRHALASLAAFAFILPPTPLPVQILKAVRRIVKTLPNARRNPPGQATSPRDSTTASHGAKDEVSAQCRRPTDAETDRRRRGDIRCAPGQTARPGPGGRGQN